MGHLAELRKRLFRSVIVVAVLTAVAFIFYDRIFDILIYPVKDVNLIYTEMTEMIGTIMRVSLFAGIIASVPYLSYEVIMFVSPALTRREKKYVFLILPWIAVMFAGGVAFSYFIVVPRMLTFLLSFGSDIATPQIKVGNYISIVSRLLFMVGIVFEFPVVTTFLARLGIVKADWLARGRKMAIVIAFIAAAIITPTIDPINQCLIAAPLIILYEMCIWLAKLVQRKRAMPEVEEVEAGPFLKP